MSKAVIVQARMSSTRLPGKVLRILDGKTYLEHCLDRCAQIPGVDQVICATTDEADCDPIVQLCRQRGYRWYRGSCADVLGRYLGAAEEAGVDAVMRITSDCPLADPEIAGRVAARFAEGGHDLVTTNIPPSWPLGLDVEMFSLDSLRQADRETRLTHDREHVTPFIRTRPLRFRLDSLGCPVEGVSHLRVTLDTADDDLFFQALARRLPGALPGLHWRALLELLRAEPELASINSDLRVIPNQTSDEK